MKQEFLDRLTDKVKKRVGLDDGEKSQVVVSKLAADDDKQEASDKKDETVNLLTGAKKPTDEELKQMDVDVSVLYEPDKFVVYDIDIFENFVEHLFRLFQLLHEIKRNEEAEKMFQRTDDKSDSKALMTFYVQIRGFVRHLLFNKEQLLDEFEYIERKVKKLIGSTQGMLVFFALHTKFLKM